MITQRVRILNNKVTTVYFYNFTTFFNLDLYEFTPLPAWIIPDNPGIIQNLELSPTVLGTYTYYFTLGGSPPAQDACLIIEIVNSLEDSVETCNNSNTKCIVWITREGGRASYLFDQRKNYGGVIGSGQTFDNNGSIKYLNRGKNFETVTVYKTGLSNTEIDLIESLRMSIQAWEYNSDTDVSTPIMLDPESYDKYSTKNKLNEIQLRYRIATYREVQSQ